MSSENILMVGNSDQNADMLYAVGVFVQEPFIYLRINGRSQIVLSDPQLTQTRQKAARCRVISLNRCQALLRKQGYKNVGPARVIQMLFRQHRRKKVRVPSDFPLGLAYQLERLKIRLKPKIGAIFPSREIKTPDEVKKISAALMMAEVGLAEGIQALKSAKIGKNRKLIYHSVPLTSEKLRAIIGTAIMQAGGTANYTIVAGGLHSCEPHEQGHGVLRAHEPIVIDIFPRSQKTGYFGDITRTVVKGRGSEALRKLYHTVERGQQIGFQMLRDKTEASQVYQSLEQFFTNEGYRTGKREGQRHGFCHPAGHGLGLEIRERPHLSEFSNDCLRVGHVVTIEPGLYYPSVGGVRLEDVALITRNGARNLTKFEKGLEI